MINKDALYNELLDSLIMNTHGRSSLDGMDHDFREKALQRYRNDAIFHADVQGFAQGVMALITKHEI